MNKAYMCKICNGTKHYSYLKNRKPKAYIARACIDCAKKRAKNRIASLSDKELKVHRDYCKDWAKKRRKNYSLEEIEKVRLIRKLSARRCKKARQEYFKKRLQNDPLFRLRVYLGNRIKTVLKKQKKSAKTLELVGCSLANLRLHFEAKFKSSMTWENYGPIWHVDHIKPCCSFDLSKQEEQRKCFHYTNLQPLFARDNLIKSGRL